MGWVKVQRQPPEVFYKRSVLKNLAEFMAKQLCQSTFLIKLQASGLRLIIKKETLAQVFSREFCEIFKNTFYRTPPDDCFWKLFFPGKLYLATNIFHLNDNTSYFCSCTRLWFHYFCGECSYCDCLWLPWCFACSCNSLELYFC